jgi:lysozyme
MRKQEYQDGLTDALSDEVTLNANQYGALVSWTFNMGVGAVSDSTLVARLNDGEDPETVASEELPKWVYAGGEVLDGLVRRRDAEVDLFSTETSDGALPVPC